LEKRVLETLDLSYGVHWPFEQRQTARNLRQSPVYEMTSQAGAVFGQLIGWERANWYAKSPEESDYEYTFEKPNWFAANKREHDAVRNSVGLFDTSSFGKIMVQGRDALQVLQRLSVRNIDVEPGRVVYTQWLNKFAGIEADVTVTRLGETEFMVLSGPVTHLRDLNYLSRHINANEFCTVTDVTGSYAMFSLMGPNSREMLQGLTDVDLANESFEFSESKEIDLGYGFVRATRLTFVGELGFELLVPSDLSRHIYSVLTEAGEDFGMLPAGYYALGSLRLEKAYRSWGHDISSNDDLISSGLGFGVAWDKPGGFIGLDSLAEIKQDGSNRRLMQLLIQDPDQFLLHDEPIFRNGELVGRCGSTGYGHTLGGAVSLAWINAPEIENDEWFISGEYEIQMISGRVPAKASLKPLYDPKSERIRS
jgi:4-methylaminobutanoate oxidase (formaldehyde-forming)